VRLNTVRTVVCLLTILHGTAWAQVGAGQVTGTVTDADGAAVPGATITATNVATAASRRAISTSAGVYTLANVAPGLYRIDVELAGFRPATREGVRIATGETVHVDVALVVGVKIHYNP
jgi:hypothetical protein